MKVYHYAPGTGEYTGSSIADPSPLESGVWLIPAHATAEKPPRVEAGHRPVWMGEKWELLQDLRGHVVWLADGSAKVIDQLGPLPDGASTTPPPEVSAEQRRAQRDALLAQSDWTQLADTLLDKPRVKERWAKYRSALRRLDMSANDWPTPPMNS